MALVMRSARAGERRHRRPDRYNELVTIHGTDGLPRRRSDPRRLRNYLVPLMIEPHDAVSAERALVLALLPRGVLMLSFFADGGAADTGWTAYPPLSTQAWNGRTCGSLAAHPDRIHGRGGDQLHRDDPQHARAR